MSFGRRLFRLAQHHAAEALDWLEDTARARPDPAREELEEFLRRPADPEPRPRTEIPRTEARRPPDPDPPLAEEYRLLGAPFGSDLETVTRCWRQRVRETHPDSFAGDSAAQLRATARLRDVNAAYERLRQALRNG